MAKHKKPTGPARRSLGVQIILAFMLGWCVYWILVRGLGHAYQTAFRHVARPAPRHAAP